MCGLAVVIVFLLMHQNALVSLTPQQRPLVADMKATIYEWLLSAALS